MILCHATKKSKRFHTVLGLLLVFAVAGVGPVKAMTLAPSEAPVAQSEPDFDKTDDQLAAEINRLTRVLRERQSGNDELMRVEIYYPKHVDRLALRREIIQIGPIYFSRPVPGSPPRTFAIPGTVTIYPREESNALIITGWGPIFDAMMDLVEALDTPGQPAQVEQSTQRTWRLAEPFEIVETNDTEATVTLYRFRFALIYERQSERDFERTFNSLQIRAAILTIVRQASEQERNDPLLSTIRAKIYEKVNAIMGDTGLVQQVILTDFERTVF